MKNINSIEEYNNKCVKANNLIKEINSTCQDLMTKKLTLTDIYSKEENLNDICYDLNELIDEIVTLRLYIDLEGSKPRGYC